MGAWIEIFCVNNLPPLFPRRTPRWVRGLKYHDRPVVHLCRGRTPRWVRGLKFMFFDANMHRFWSHPTMGAWIEIYVSNRYIEG